MKKFGYIIICMMFVSCDYIFDLDAFTPNELVVNDYRLFKETPAWELAKATRSGNTKKMEEIIKKNPVVVNYQEPKYGQTLLMLTILNQQYKPFKTLLNNNADVNIHDYYDGSSAIIKSVEYPWSSIRFVDALVSKGANINDIEIGERRVGNSTRKSVLIAAVSSGKIDLIRYIIGRGANINYYNEFDQSAFSKAIMLGKYEISYFLLQNGADYMKPIFFRPDYSIPSEQIDSLDKGEPVYLVNSLKEDFVDFRLPEYKYKMKIVQFLQKRGVDYWNAPVPEFIQERIKKEHSNNWQEYIKKY